MGIKAIIIDDERYAREELRFLLEAYDDIQVVAEVSRGIDAMTSIHELQPDVIFLDIEMPRMNGIDIAQELQSHNMLDVAIIFTTAYPQFAVDAFRVDALDYLLKPYKEDLLSEAIDRLRHAKGTNTQETVQVDRIKGELRGATHYVSINQIIFIHTKGKVTQMFTKDDVYHFNGSLKDAHELLGSHGFYQTHRSYLVNVSGIKSIAPAYNASFDISLHALDAIIPLSRNYAKGLFERLESE